MKKFCIQLLKMTVVIDVESVCKALDGLDPNKAASCGELNIEYIICFS